MSNTSFKEFLNEAKPAKPFFKKVESTFWAININAVDNDFPTKPFGHQLDYLRTIKQWKTDSNVKKGYADTKHISTMKGVRNWVKINTPSEFYAKWSNNNDDTVEIFYKD